MSGVYKRIVRDLGGHRTIQLASVQYAANGIWRLIDDPPNYFDNLSKGVKRTMAYLRTRAAECPNQQIVLAGFSQGAMVMHRVLHKLEPTTSGQRVLARLSDAILIGDGDQVPHDNGVVRYGTAPLDARGVGLGLRKLSHSSAAKFGQNLGDRVLSVCNSHDIVCGWTDTNILKCLTLAANCPVAVRKMVKIHLGYPGSRPLNSAADQAVHDVRVVPLPTPRTVKLTAPVGRPFSYQFKADVGPGYTLQWGVVPPEVMPAGLTLNGGGLISGTPTAIGTSTTLIRVRSLRSGRRSLWVSATIKLDVSANSAGTWTATEAPLPDNAAANSANGAGLSSTACPSAAACTAVGSYTDSAGDSQGLLESGSESQPGAWTAVQAPLPINADSDPEVGLDAVTCPATTTCAAVGSYEGSDAITQDPVVLWRSGSTWTPTELTMPANNDPANTTGPGAYSVACASTSQCAAIGDYYETSGSEAWIASGSGSSWAVTEAPVPAGVASTASRGLSSIACTKAMCTAVGWYVLGGVWRGMVVWGSGSAWTATVIALPSNAISGNSLGALYSIGCPSTGNCVTVGRYATAESGGANAWLIAIGSESTWKAVPATLPANAEPYSAVLSSVACPSASSCTVAGGYIDASITGPSLTGYGRGLLLTESGTSWTAAEAPLPPGTPSQSTGSLALVSCVSEAACTAIGGFKDLTDNRIHNFVVTMSGTSVRVAAAPVPSNEAASGYVSPGVSAIACAAISACTAVGSYPDSSGNDDALVLTGPG